MKYDVNFVCALVNMILSTKYF